LKKVLILGGGFAGLEAAIYLKKEHYDVTLVSERDFLYIYPTSIWVPTRESNFDDVKLSLYELASIHAFKLIVKRVEKIEAAKKLVMLEDGTVLEEFDYYVIALGAGKMKHEGIENTQSICGQPEQALKIRDGLDTLLEQKSGKIAMGFGGNPKDSSGVRGGPAFELLFNVHHLLKKKGIRNNFELAFFAPMEKPGARMGPKALDAMASWFERLNITPYYGKKFKRFETDGIVFEDDSKLASDLTMFIPGGDGLPIIKSSDLPTNDAGFITINDYCQVEFEHGVSDTFYAIGDCAALQGPDWRAKQGHIAEVMARNVAFNIAAADKGMQQRKGYEEHLNILCVMDSGNGAAFVYRDDKKAKLIPMPIIGHWLKKGWGHYYRLSKRNKIPRIPGM